MIKVDDKVIRVMLVGRIIEEDEVFKHVEEVAAAFARWGGAEFYLMDARTQ
jgi:hypothetical protein